MPERVIRFMKPTPTYVRDVTKPNPKWSLVLHVALEGGVLKFLTLTADDTTELIPVYGDNVQFSARPGPPEYAHVKGMGFVDIGTAKGLNSYGDPL